VQLIPTERLAFALDILAESIEIVVVQMLIPVKKGTQRLAIHEILRKSSATTNCIKTSNWTGLASEVEYGVERGQQTFSRSLDNAKLRGLISEEDYKETKKRLQRTGMIK
jgi:Tfp pilus assembly pilus retraction ATPase PilT